MEGKEVVESADIINTVLVWISPMMIGVLVYLWKRDQKQRDEERKEFKQFMLSQREINEANSVILTRLTTIQEMQGNK
tara:strand:+ start:989 stop:1222 length:234 start_codon:yes stop_codon:yes gene_type:complete